MKQQTARIERPQQIYILDLSDYEFSMQFISLVHVQEHEHNNIA